METELHEERKKSHKLEQNFINASEEVNRLKKDNDELARQNVRCTNLQKVENGHRGRCKDKETVSRSQTYKRCAKELQNIRETLLSFMQ